MRPPTILCADIERHVLPTLRNQLQRYFPNCAIEIAESGSKALEMVDAFIAEGIEVPVVIAGQVEPVHQGHPFLIDLHRRHPQILNLLVVGGAGQASVADMVNLVNQGGLYRCLNHPWTEADLQQTVSAALHQYQQQRGLTALHSNLKQQLQHCGQERQQAQQQLRLFVEHAPAAIAMFDRDMRYILASKRWKTDYGLGEQSIIGRSHYEVFPELPDRWKAIHQRCLTGATEQAEEDFFVRADGSVTWNQWEIHPWYTDEGEIGGIVMFTQVLTERKLAQLALQESEERNRAILSAVPDIMTVISADGYYLDVSFNQFAGETIPMKLNGHMTEVLPPEAARSCLAAIQQALQTGEIQTHEYQIPFGERIQYEEIRIVPYQIDKVLCLVRDVTERKQIELEIIQSRDLREAIFHESADALFLVDPQTLLTLDCNQRAVELFEAEAKDALIHIAGHTLQRFQFTPAELDEIAAEISAQSFWSREIEYVTLQGKVFWGNIAAKRIHVAGQALNLVRVTDITHRKQTAAQLEAQNSLLARIAQGAPLSEVLHCVITRIEQQVPGAMGSVLLLDETDCLQHGSAPNLPPDYIQAVEGVRIGEGVGSCGTAAYVKQVVVSPEIATDPRWASYKEFALAHGLRACWSIPLMASDGRVLGTFGLYYNQPRTPQGNELEQISQLANIAGIAIERDRAAAQIRRSEEQLKLTLDFTGIGVWSWNPNTDEYVWNQQMVELLQIPSGSTGMFQTWCDRIHPDDLNRVQTSIQVALAARTSFAEEYRYRLQDGRWVWRWFKGQGIYTETGEVERVLGIVQNITERKQAEAAMAAMESEQRSILENIPGFVVKVDRDSKMLFLNRTAPGFAMADVVGRNLDEFTAPESRQVQREALEQVFSTGVATTIETVGVSPDQTLAYYEVRIAPVFQQDQVEAAIMVVTDVTARKKVEVALRQSEAKQRALIRALPDLIMRISDEGVYLDFFAPNSFNSIGKTGDFVGKRVNESLPPHLAHQRMNAIRDALHTGELQVYEQEIVAGGVLQIEECRVVVCGANEVLVIGRDISDRKRAERALRESEERRRLALDLTGTGSWEFMVATGEATWSDSHYRLMGLVPGEQPSNYQTWRERVHPADLEWVEQAFAQALATHTLLDTEYRVTHPDGTVRWMLTKGQGIYNITGEAMRMVGVMTDVTDRKLAEQALQQLNEELELRVQQRTQDLLASQAEVQAKEQFLRGVFEGTDNPLFVVDVLENGSFQFTGWNRASEQISGVSTTRAIGKSPETVFPGAIGIAITDNYQRCCNAGQMIRYEENLVFETGEAWTLTTLTPLKNAQGRIYRIVGSVFDITDRKRTEEMLQQQLTAIEASNEGIAITNAQGEYTYLNNAHVEIFGYDHANELIGKTWKTLYQTSELAWIERTVLPIMAQQGVWQGEMIAKRKDGSLFFEELTLTLLPDGRMVSVCRDISDRKRLEQDLLQINAELEQRVVDRTQDLQQAVEAAQTANRAKSIFLANMSHELRTPLNAILGFSQLLHRDSNLTPDQQDQVNIINRSGAHLLNLINDVLTMSKIEAGRTTLTINRFNLRELLQDLEELFRLKARTKRSTLTMQIDATVPDLMQADESKLRQVLINLISNAIKFTEQGGITVRVWPAPSPDSQIGGATSMGLQFEVEDTGLGIAPDEWGKVFEPFEQTQSGRNSQEGTGLGMPISRQFVRLMGGELGFQSNLNQGTTFHFTIPVQQVEAEGDLAELQTAKVIGLATDQPNYRLLVVEDHADNRQFLVQLLRSVGFEVQTAGNGQEAIHLWQTWAPHLIWMDLRMPVMNGYDATQHIRLLEQQPESLTSDRPIAKILALTASAFEDDRELILAAGCDDFLFKPITEAILFEKMAQHLGVCYRYQQQSTLLKIPATPSDNGWIEQELQRMPSDWITQLRYAARIADEDMMLRVLDQLPITEARLAVALKELVTAFQIERLIELTEDANET